MGQRRARQLCPQAIVVPARFKAYSEASKAVFRVFEDTAPVVEALSIDEAFLDVRGMERSVGTPLEIARTLRRRVRDEVGLPITVGVARTKFLAKVASGVAKPDGLLLVPPDEGAGVPPSTRGRAAVGRRAGHVAEAARRRHLDRRRGRAHGRGAADRARRPRARTPPVRARAQPRPAARRDAAPAADRSARNARAAAGRGRRASSTPT